MAMENHPFLLYYIIYIISKGDSPDDFLLKPPSIDDFPASHVWWPMGRSSANGSLPPAPHSPPGTDLGRWLDVSCSEKPSAYPPRISRGDGKSVHQFFSGLDQFSIFLHNTWRIDSQETMQRKTQRQLPAPAPPWADLCSSPALAAWAIWRRPTGRAILQALPGTGPAGGRCLNRPSICSIYGIHMYTYTYTYIYI